MYIRVDGNEIISIGHVMRCLAIAEELRELEEESIFILADEKSRTLIESKGFSVIILNSQWNNLDDEINNMVNCIQKFHIEKLLIDSYFVTYRYLKTLKEYTKLTYIDGVNAFAYPVDKLINYGIMAHEMTYKNTYRKAYKNTKFYIGCDYVPLRKEFNNVRYNVEKDIKNILITTGGTDNYNFVGNILKQVVENNKFKNMNFHVVVGAFNKNIEELYNIASRYHQVIIYENISNMSKLMEQCDIAVTAAGTTMYELSSVGIPSICVSIADNQKKEALFWEREGLMFYGGDMQCNLEKCIHSVLEYLCLYINDYFLRKEKSKKMRRLVDGNGARRIAEILQMEEN